MTFEILLAHEFVEFIPDELKRTLVHFAHLFHRRPQMPLWVRP